MKKIISLALCGLFASAIQLAAATVTLNFDSAATGSNLLSSPLATSAGTVSVLNGSSIEGAYASNATQWLRNDQRENAGYTTLSFSFDVSSISFDFTGYGIGSFSAELLDINSVVIGSYFLGDATLPEWHTGPTLSASGIRAFRFRDTVSNQSGIDNVVLTVPDFASTLGLMVFSFAGLVTLRRRFAK